MKTIDIITRILINEDNESTIYTFNKNNFIKQITNILNEIEIPFIIGKKDGIILLINKTITIIEIDSMKRNENCILWKWLDE